MRVVILSIFVLTATFAAAQQPPISLNPQGQAATGVQAQPVAQANPVPNEARLDALLKQWEEKMKSVNALEAEVTRTETDPIEKRTEVYQGKVRFLRPDRASVYLAKSSNPQIYEQYVFTGAFLYEYRPQSKIVRIHELPVPQPGQKSNFEGQVMLSFLTGMKATDAKERFGLTLVKEDENYVYLYVDPKHAGDKQDFSKARLVLWKATMLPRQLEFEDPNKSIVKWDIPRIDGSAKISASDFAPPNAPKDWKTERVPRMQQQPTAAPTAGGVTPVQPPPTKVRPKGQ